MIINPEQSFNKLRAYCESENFKGWDPYDGLNSRVFQTIPLLKDIPWARLAWIQLFKRNPLNLRKFLLVNKDYNAKGIALFIRAYCYLYKKDQDNNTLNIINFLSDKLIELRTPGYSGSCWGYNFPWQARAFYQPAFTPTVVATTYAGNALLDAYDITGNEKFKMYGLSTAEFIIKDLHRTYDNSGNFAFSYSPEDKTQVFNASLLGSRMLSRVYNYSGDSELINFAAKSVAFCCKHQEEDGSWNYGTLPFHQWKDNFHTGFNLECIYEYQKYSNDKSFNNYLIKGLKYYADNFFSEEGIPKYYNNSCLPVDIHSSAQFIITLHSMDITEEYSVMAEKVMNWTIKHMQDQKGYFYYQKKKYYTIKIPYMRWSQAWMFLALTIFLYAFNKQ